MKKFFIRAILFILLPLPILYSISYMVDSGLRKSHNFLYAEWNDLMKGRINADVLVCGSSRAWVSVSPAILDTVLHTNSYNIGMDGTQFSMQYDRFKVYLQHNKSPKYVVQIVDFTTFAENGELHAYQQFLPYLYDSSIRALTSHYKGKFGAAEYYFPLYKYNNEMLLIKEGLLSYFNKGVPALKYKGYRGQDRQWNTSFKNFVKNVPKGRSISVDTNSVRLMREYLWLCEQKGIKVILVFAPVYNGFLKYCTNKDYILDTYKSMEVKDKVIFLDYLEDDLSMHRGNFYNSQHLNRNGAEAFSLKLAHDLQLVLAASASAEN